MGVRTPRKGGDRIIAEPDAGAGAGSLGAAEQGKETREWRLVASLRPMALA